MSTTISSKTKSITLGGSGFKRLRSKVAELAGGEIKKHYDKLNQFLCISIRHRKAFFEDYDRRTEELIEKYKDLEPVFDFLYASDCSAEFSPEECQCIWEVIKDYDDDISYGYPEREDCAKFADFKEIVKECVDIGCELKWS